MFTRKKALRILENHNIFVTRKRHPNDFTLSKRIQSELICESPNVLHIGAHLGQEALFYNECGAKVIWIEANPELVTILKEYLNQFADNSVINALLGDELKESVSFNVFSNQGASSSIFEYSPQESQRFGLHLEKVIKLDMKRLDTIFTSKDLLGYRHWVLDVQGAELKVLKGAGELLSNVESLLIESRNTSVYQGGCNWNELVYFLQDKGFKNLWSPINDEEDDILFIRKNYASNHSHNSSIQVES